MKLYMVTILEAEYRIATVKGSFEAICLHRLSLLRESNFHELTLTYFSFICAFPCLKDSRALHIEISLMRKFLFCKNSLSSKSLDFPLRTRLKRLSVLKGCEILKSSKKGFLYMAIERLALSL